MRHHMTLGIRWAHTYDLAERKCYLLDLKWNMNILCQGKNNSRYWMLRIWGVSSNQRYTIPTGKTEDPAQRVDTPVNQGLRHTSGIQEYSGNFRSVKEEEGPFYLPADFVSGMTNTCWVSHHNKKTSHMGGMIVQGCQLKLQECHWEYCEQIRQSW